MLNINSKMKQIWEYNSILLIFQCYNIPCPIIFIKYKETYWKYAKYIKVKQKGYRSDIMGKAQDRSGPSTDIPIFLFGSIHHITWDFHLHYVSPKFMSLRVVALRLMNFGNPWYVRRNIQLVNSKLLSRITYYYKRYK